jgi:NADPH-dependent 2,4-dienoyl-CoA reductase/sulfur reductase-like enzyme
MRILIIGGVAAGMSAAARAKRTDGAAEVVVYDKRDIVSFGACGLPYFVGGHFDEESRMIARSPAQLAQAGIDVRIGHEVLEIRPAEKTILARNGRGEIFEDRWDRLMIASGANPVLPPVANLNLGNVFTLTTLADGRRLRAALDDPSCREVAVIGAGFIGLETVEALHRRGKSVRLFQLDDRVLPDAFDREATEAIEAELRASGIELHLAETVTELRQRASREYGGPEGRDRVGSVVTASGEYPADAVVVAAGVRPATAFAREIGLAMLPNGAIIVDRRGRTNLPDIFAAGDCAAIPHIVLRTPVYAPLATGANKLGRVVGYNLAGKPSEYPGTLASACIKVLGIEAGRTGASEREAEKAGLPFATTFIKDKDHADYFPPRHDIGVKLVWDPATRRLLGGQVFGGQGAVLRTDVLAAAIAGGLTVDQLGFLDLCYAPPFARTWDALNVAGNAAK